MQPVLALKRQDVDIYKQLLTPSVAGTTKSTIITRTCDTPARVWRVGQDSEADSTDSLGVGALVG